MNKTNIAIINAQWHEHYTEQLATDCESTLINLITSKVSTELLKAVPKTNGLKKLAQKCVNILQQRSTLSKYADSSIIGILTRDLENYLNSEEAYTEDEKEPEHNLLEQYKFWQNVTSKQLEKISQFAKAKTHEQSQVKEIAEPLLKLKVARFQVPGSAELPLAAKLILESGAADAVVCIGVLLKGETDHYEYIAQQVTQGCARVSLDTGSPVIFGVLTCNKEQQIKDRIDGTHSRCGQEWAQAVLKMLDLKQSLPKRRS